MGKLLIAILAAWALLAAAPAATAQQAGGIVIIDDGAVIDEELLRREHEQLVKLLTEDPQAAVRSGLLKKTEFCLICRKTGARAPCTSPFGGESGKMWCASQCLYKCKSACGVAARSC
jgi:hypothetical protein